MRTKRATAALKKDHERWALDRFLVILKAPTPETIEPNEEPDFVLTFGSRRVGIEMTIAPARARTDPAHYPSDEVNPEGQVVRFLWLRARDLNRTAPAAIQLSLAGD
jgi:hypothetical protein